MRDVRVPRPSRRSRAQSFSAGRGPHLVYALRMDTLSILKLGLTGFGVAGILYACIGTGFLQNNETGWWEGLPKEKRLIFVAAIVASLLQTFF